MFVQECLWAVGYVHCLVSPSGVDAGFLVGFVLSVLLLLVLLGVFCFHSQFCVVEYFAVELHTRILHSNLT